MRDIAIRGLYKAFGEKQVLRDFHAVFKAGEISCVMGPSGCGKTTLMNILMGIEKADRGAIESLPERIAAVFQEERLCEGFSALSNVRLVTGKAVAAPEIASVLDALGLDGNDRKPVREFSGGMKRRVSIARALLAESELLILDEPFKGLDEATRRMAAEYIGENRRGKTVIMVTHDVEEAALMGASVIRMEPVTQLLR